jgi:Flp pilus assembly pilin Flp
MHVWHDLRSVGNVLRLGWPRGRDRRDRRDRRSRGQGYVEYAVILLLVVLVMVVLLVFLGPQIASLFQGIENNL